MEHQTVTTQRVPCDAYRSEPRGPRKRARDSGGAGCWERAFERALAYGEAAGTALAETLWPTRCAVCDTPGEAVCQACLRSLPYLDWWRACPRCGAPFGRVQCSECNPVTMAALDRHELPFDACASAVVYNDATARIVRAWKDAGERRLVETLADLMASVTAPSWRAERPTIVPVPATAAALRKRGFDHGTDLARALAERLSLDEIPLLARPRSFDQRSLARSGRIKNMENRFKPLPGARAPASVLIVDDVYTTGATLFAASEAARAAGARQVRCVTFARVW